MSELSKRLYNFISQNIRPIELASFLKSILRIKRFLFKTKDGIFFIDPISNFGNRLLNELTYEENIRSQLFLILRESDTFIDLGSNEGYFSVIASNIIKEKGKVFAVEPQIRLLHVIENNIKENNLMNITIVPFGISDKNEKLNLILTPSINTGSSSFINSFRSVFWTKQLVECISLDELFVRYKIPHTKLIKIDVEGFDLKVLMGAEYVLKNKLIDYIILESHSVQLSKINQSVIGIDKLLTSFGYKKINEVYTHLN